MRTCPHSAARLVALVAVGLVSGGPVALAQEPPEDEPGSEEESTGEPPPPEPAPVSFREGFGWAPFGPRDLSGVTDLDVAAEAIAFVSGAGDAWLSTDGGERWDRVLPPLPGLEASRDEEVSLAIEARVREIFEELQEEGEDPEEFDEEELEEILAEATREVTAAVAVDVESEVLEGWWVDVVRSGADVARSHVFLPRKDTMIVGRRDGTFVSVDGGRTFRKALEQQVFAVEQVPSTGLWVAGTSDGIRLSSDLRAWIDIEDGTEGVMVFALDHSATGMYAATSAGLWFAERGEVWKRLGTLDVALLDVTAAPGGELWVATPTEMLRLTPDGSEVDQAFQGPVAGVMSIRFLSADHLLAAGSEGVWESMDGGVSWGRVVRGLSIPRASGLWAEPGRVLVGSTGGLYRLVPVDPDAAPRRALAEVLEAWAPLEGLVQASLERPGVRRKSGIERPRLLATLSPRAHLEFYYWPDGDLRYTDTSGTQRGSDSNWVAFARLEWRGLPNRNLDANEVLVLGDQVALVDDVGDQRAMLARLDRAYADRQHYLVDLVSELYFRRAQLVRERADMARASLLRQVEAELAISEVEARIDLLTDGAVSRWYNAQ